MQFKPREVYMTSIGFGAIAVKGVGVPPRKSLMSQISNPSTDIVERLLVFPSDLGWMAVAMSGDAVRRLTFGHRSETAARKRIVSSLHDSSLSSSFSGRACPTCFIAADTSGTPDRFTVTTVERRLIARLQRYAAGTPDTLDDISVDFGPTSEFRRRILTLCRRIPYGRTVSYSELAAQAGSPRAARAVGNCMAANAIPLVIPCHRVICADGRIGVYSAPGGTAMKQRLLAMEQKPRGTAIPP